MTVTLVKEKLEKSLERLESAIELKLTHLESENSKLRAEVVRLKAEVKKLADTKSTPAPAMPLTDLVASTPTETQNDSTQLSDVHLSLSKLKKLVS